MSYRSPIIRAMHCIACFQEGQEQPNPTEEHHLNLGGKAGQKRRGDDYSVPLCQWHHRAVMVHGHTAADMDALYGPSLARTSRAFREAYGTDDELLLAINNKLDGVIV
jgi:hypothetical protein